MRVAAVDGVKTPEGLGTCGLDTEIEQFGKYVTGIPNEVVLWPKETRRFQPTITFPTTLSGEQHGCIAYFDAAQLSGDSISLVYRNAHVLRVNLLAPVSRGLFTQVPSAYSKTTTSTSPWYIHVANGSGLVAVEAVNTGTITQRVAAKCELTTKWWWTHTYSTFVTWEVAWNSKYLLACEFPGVSPLVLWAEASISLAYQSVWIADQPLIKLPEELTVPKTIVVQRSRFFFPHQLIIALVWLGILAIVLVRIFLSKRH
jgi:hypothetical protein